MCTRFFWGSMREEVHMEDLDIDGSIVSQDRKCMCKRNVHVCPWERSIALCVCSLRRPACNAHAPYFTAVRDLSGCSIFLHITSQTAGFSLWGGGWW